MKSKVDSAKVLAYTPPDTKVSFNKKDLLLYALSIGCDEPQYTYENDLHFAAFPTYPVVLPMKGTSQDINPFGQFASIPGMEFDPNMIVHGEQTLEIFRTIPLEGIFTHRSKVVGLYDKGPGKGCVVVRESQILAPSGDLIVKSQTTTIIRGLGGFGGDRGPSNQNVNIPPKDRNADFIVEFGTGEKQALFYRLNADFNPLHVDPNVAKAVGFEKPILHGLCTFAICARAILKVFGDNNSKALKSISVRFAGIVLPGQTLVISMWKESDSKIIFNANVKETGKPAIANAVAILHNFKESKL
eukprot:TRINITY_DN7149_c0_g1_i1.p1 TRINITY_DN7149_c0_g1~~TRINITY_DN7149_c0_g1_i1.p1  ORF type:complete len:301 (+),score=58.63 TRINITY_DN7149_c0_g1_i1:36-938(+)